MDSETRLSDREPPNQHLASGLPKARSVGFLRSSHPDLTRASKFSHYAAKGRYNSP